VRLPRKAPLTSAIEAQRCLQGHAISLAFVSLLKTDGTAVLVDACEGDAGRDRMQNARRIPLRDASKAKDDGRLPMSDHNTRIFVVGDNGGQARAVPELAATGAVTHPVNNRTRCYPRDPRFTWCLSRPSACR
jgi:hypothetical protein